MDTIQTSWNSAKFISSADTEVFTTQQALWVLKQYQKKEDCTIPMVAVSQPYCCAMGRMAMLMFTLSMLHNMKAMKHNPIMVQRRFHLLAVPTTYKHTRLVGAEVCRASICGWKRS